MRKSVLIVVACMILIGLVASGGVAQAQYYSIITDASHPASGSLIVADNGIPFYSIVSHNAGILEVHETPESVWPTDSLELHNYGTKAHFLVYSAFSTTVPDNVLVATLSVHYEDGDSVSIDLIEGVNIAEWAYDRPENQVYLAHTKIPPIYSWMTNVDSQYWYEGHLFYVSIDLEPKPLDGVGLVLKYFPHNMFAVRVAGMTLENAPPLAEVGGPYTVDEGSCVTLTGSGTDPQGLPLTYAWDLNGDGVFETPGQVVPFCGVDGPATKPVALEVCNSAGLCATDTSTVTINNVPPTVGPITAPVNPVPVNTAINASASFTDPGILDTHTAVWDWGDGASSPGVVAEVHGSGSVAGSHTYTAPGVYTITLTVTDKDGGQGSATYEYVVVYNPGAGFVTGGGWINSPPGAYKANPKLTGTAHFGFVAQYKKGSMVPTGNTEFQFQVGNLNFHSTSYQWLVVAGARAQYKGTGSINGKGNYGLTLTAIDGQVQGGGGVDKFRIKITLGSNVIYDNQMGAPDSANPTTAIAGGSIVIHQ